ncbi:MAG TPA: discoidin domain-containing protein [Planctomycetota bacterium]|nr:discoidin domain-containing protein [Planctomycetota bacterium]
MREVVSVLHRMLALAALLAAASAAEPGPPIAASSVHSDAYLPRYALDGNPQTRWASGAFSGKPEWLQLDFGKVMPVDNVVIHWETALAIEYQLQVSRDGTKWETLHHQTSGKGGREVVQNLKGEGRYLRLLCLKPGRWNLFSVWELECLKGQGEHGMAALRRRMDAAREKAESEARRRLAEALPDHGIEEIVFALRQPGRDGHWYANFGYYAQDDRRKTYGPGGKLCRLNLRTGERTVLLDDPQGGVRDPVVHYDAKKILFSCRKGDSPYYHLYEIGADGQNLRQLTDGPADDIEPCYLPDGGIVFVSSRCNRWVNCWVTPVAVLYRCDGDGGNLRPISSNNEHDNTPWVLPSGQVIYTRWEYVDRSQVDYHHLWIANPDGTAQMTFFGNLHPGGVFIDAKPIPNSEKIVAIHSGGHGAREHAGAIALIDPRSGPDARPAMRTVPGGSYRDPWALAEDLFLAAEDRRIVLVNAAGKAIGVYQCRAEEVAAGLQCHEPRPLAPRPRERLIAPRVDLQQETGRLVLMDVCEGRNMAGVERDEVKKLLVLESLPKPINFTGGMDPLSYGGTFTLERVLGTVPVEPDGSAYFEAPALRSLFFVALDASDLSVKRMQSFVTVQPGETTGCVGCHEPRTQAPPEPRQGAALAMLRPPSPIEPIRDCPDVFDFPRDIQPILDRLCVACHGYEKTARGGPYAGKVALTGDRGPMFSHAYFTMTVRRLFSDGRNLARSNYPPRTLGSSASRILKMLDGSHYDVKATEQQKRMLRLWIESGAPYPGTYAALGNGAIGGYWTNGLINTDSNWPTTKAGAQVIQRRCAACHTGHSVLPKAMCDERGISFWRFDLADPRLKLSRHIVFNLTRPERSLLLLAPLAKAAGGLELCRDKQDKPAVVFADTADPDHRALLAMVEAGKHNLETIGRFDMPGFRPPPQYLREMKRYGILPPDLSPEAKIDVYETDRKYWESLHYRAGQR